MAQAVKVDMTQGSLWDKIIRFAVPVALMAFLQQLFNSADSAVIGHFAGTEAMAAVGGCGAMCSFVLSLGTGMSLGANVTIATNIGAGDRAAVRRAVHTALIVAVCAGVILCLFGEAVIASLMSVMGIVDPAVEAMAVDYMRIYLLALPVILLYDFQAAIMRSQGDTHTPIIALTAAGIVNIALDLFFVLVCHWGVGGVAAATLFANIASSMVLLAFLMHSDSIISVNLRELAIDAPSLKRIVSVGLPAGMQGALFSVSNVIIQSALNSLNTAVMAGSSAANNLDAYSWYSLNAFGQTCTTFVGQNNGARRHDRCVKTLKLCFIEGYCAYAVIAAILLLFNMQLLSIFSTDPAVIAAGSTRVRYIMLTHLFTVAVEIMSGYLRGFGMSLPPTIVSFVAICLFRVFWVVAIFPIHGTYASLLAAYPISVAISAVVLLCLTVYLGRHIGRAQAAEA